MTDLHTHILPGMDDGAATVADSLAMLNAQQMQGVQTVVLTPHFYRNEETVSEFLARRGRAMETLEAALPQEHPQLLLGAEVTWYQSILQEEELEKLCISGTNCVLLELPYIPWTKMVLEQLFQFEGITGITPIIAHVDRYLAMQKKETMEELFDMGLPMQLNCEALLQPMRRKKILAMLRQGRWHLGTDCHNMRSRSPKMEKAVQYMRKRLPEERVNEILSWL